MVCVCVWPGLRWGVTESTGGETWVRVETVAEIYPHVPDRSEGVWEMVVGCVASHVLALFLISV